MNGCDIPAPAPCASTRQALGRSGTRSKPETVLVSSISIVRRCGGSGSNSMSCRSRWVEDGTPEILVQGRRIGAGEQCLGQQDCGRLGPGIGDPGVPRPPAQP